jgi:FdhD protein
LIDKPVGANCVSQPAELEPASRRAQAQCFRSSEQAFSASQGWVERLVATETPVSFFYDDKPYAVMMASPHDLEDFAYGFSLTENIIHSEDEIRAIKVAPLMYGSSIQIELIPDPERAKRMRRRAIAGRTGCGFCGIETMAALPQANVLVSETEDLPIPVSSIFVALEHLDKNQKLNALTGAFHAAAFCGRSGVVNVVREDVGRHNALDKLIGALMQMGISPRDGFFLITSRASFEMVEKAASFRVKTLAAISAPTALAIERAKALGVTLAALVRSDSLLVFSGNLGN